MYMCVESSRGNCTPKLKLPCAVCNLNIINTFFGNKICVLSKLSNELKNGIGILVGQEVLSYGLKQKKNCCGQKNLTSIGILVGQEVLSYGLKQKKIVLVKKLKKCFGQKILKNRK